MPHFSSTQFPIFFIGAGPRFTHDFTGHLEGASAAAGQPTTIDGELVIGGWWGGTPDAAHPSDAQAPTKPARRFGEAREWVLTAESGVSISSTRYSVQGSSSSVFADSGFDYFFVKNVSVGANVYVESDSSSGVAASGAPYTNSSTYFGLTGHFAVNVPLGPWLSLYPRSYLGVGGGSYSDTSGSSTSQATETEAWVALYAPLLVHPAPHFFLGFGPSVRQDILNGSGDTRTSARW